MFTTGRLLFQYSIDIAVESYSVGYSRVNTGVCEGVYKQHLHHC